MIKRILPFVLAFAFLLSFMVSPMRVKADTSSARVNILDFCGVNGSVSNNVTITDSGVASFDVRDLLGSLKSYNFEILLSWSGDKPSSFSLSNGAVSFTSTATDITSSMMRIIGTCSGYYVGNYILSITSPGDSYIVFHSFNVDLVSSNRLDIGTTLTAHGGSSVDIPAGGNSSIRSPSGVTSALFSFRIPYAIWSKFDYIDFSGFISNGEMTTITANTTNDAFIPISTSVVEDMASRSFYYYSCRLDLSQGNLGNSGDLAVWFTADVINGSGELGLWGLSGVILGEPFDTQNTWYQILLKYMRSGFSSVTDSLQGVEDAIFDHLDLVDQWFSEVNTNIDAEFTGLKTNLQTEFTSLKTKLQTEFTSLKTALSTHFTNITNNLRTWFTNMQTLLTTKFDAVISKLQELIDGQPVDEGVTDDMQQADDELGNMTDQMENLSPTINSGDVNVDVDDLVSQEGVSSVTSVFSIFTGNAFISVMLTIVIGMATAGYVFFGKR